MVPRLFHRTETQTETQIISVTQTPETQKLVTVSKNGDTQEPTEKKRTYIRGNSACQTDGERNNKGSLALGVLKVLQKDKAIWKKTNGYNRQKSYTTGYTYNSRLQKGITILFCKQTGQSPSTNYASSLNGFKME